VNIPASIARQVVDNLKATPFLLALLVLNIIVLAGFAWTLNEVSNAMERREAVLKTCLDRR
jgi:hypothetical protein